MSFTNLDKVYWPEEKWTKGDMIRYYHDVSPYLLPYLKDRPITLKRYPEGILGNSFFQKDVETHPPWVKTIAYKKVDKTVNYVLCQDLETLLYIANLGSIEIHTFNDTVKSQDKPTYCVIDLDPLDTSFESVIITALMTHQILEEVGIRHYCKTSGATGLHIYMPLEGKYTTEQSLKFSELIATLTYQRLPKICSLERNPDKRRNRVYIDFLQNAKGKTMIAPYSLRALPGAPVSTPLEWKEVTPQLDVKTFTLKTIQKRLLQKKDLFKPVIGRGINLTTSILQRLEKFT